MPHFFISYRRSDREGNILAHVLFRELRRRYGEDSAFLDVDSRSPGLSFPVKVERALRVTDVVLAIIGPAWLQTLTERLGDSLDWVRYEVAESLKRSELPVVPVCLAGVEMPRSHQLPEELKDLSSRDGVTLDPCEDFESHLARLLSDVEHVLETTRRETEDLRLATAREAASTILAAERAAKERAAVEERETKRVLAEEAAKLAAQEAAVAERAAAQAAKVQKEAEPEPQRAREAPTSSLGHKPLPVATSRSTSVSGPSTAPKGAARVVPSRPVNPPAMTSTVKAPVVPSRPVSPPAKSGAVKLQAAPSRPASPPVASGTVKAPVAKYYRLSGRFTFAGLILSLLVIGLMIFVLALGYSYGLLSLPFAQANFVLTLLYGLLSGLAAGFALKWCRVRNSRVACWVGLASGLGAVHLSWAVWLYGHLGPLTPTGLPGLLELAASPARLWHLLRGINETGSWNIWGYKPTGVVLWLLWSLEAVLITGLSTLVSFFTVELGDAFCEACGTQCKLEGGAKLRNCDRAELKRRLEMKDFAFLAALGARRSGSQQWLALNLWRCKKCGTTNALDAYVATMTTDAKGRPTTNFAPVLTGLLVTTAECTELQRIGREAAASTKRS
ncbi:MAG TPA: TIR domain-containing protein [Thermoanaerobaculia bacterium]|nr:TIR domain-containing protein [Thermoanaerobaculia bacterium]